MQKAMQEDAAVFRTGETLENGQKRIDEIYKRHLRHRRLRPLDDLEQRSRRDAGVRESTPVIPSPASASGSGASANSSSAATNSSAAGSPTNTASIASKVDPALVDINSTFSYQSEAGAGTGIVLSANGEVVTNNHVVDGATKISVTDLGNGKTYTATVVGYDPTHDLAVLQLQNASGLTTASIGNSSKLTVDTPVVGIGNAGGAGGTPSTAGGEVTALNQVDHRR